MSKKFDQAKVEKALHQAAASAVSGPPEEQSGRFTGGSDVVQTRRERLRRVVLVCCLFARNLAYHRAGHESPMGWKDDPLHATADFWRTANANFVDICILEWCKLFADDNGKHHWKNIISDPDRFEGMLFETLICDDNEFRAFQLRMRKYRDRFIAHLDSDLTMQIPVLDRAKASVEFYHRYVVTTEARPGELIGLPDTAEKFRTGYTKCFDEATSVYSATFNPQFEDQSP